MTDVVRTITAITSTVGSGASVSTFSRKVTTPWRSPVKMTRRTTPGHVRLEEILNNNKHGGLKRPYLMIRRKSKTGVPTRAQSSRWRARVECVSARTCFFVGSLERSVQSSPTMQLMNTLTHSGERLESNVPDRLWDWWNEDQQRQWLQFQPWESTDSWHRYGIVASRTDHQQNHSSDQWIHWNVGDWNR